MSITDELRRLLDERGVEWRDSSDENVLHTTWNDMNCWFNEFPDGWTAWGMAMRGTPEQVIAATLGETPTPPPPTPPKQPPYDELIESLQRDWDIEASWDGLRRFWYVGLTDEGVRKRDEREATLGRGECRNAAPSYLDFLCSECGFVHYHSDTNDTGDGNEWHYCPNCGRKVVDE